MTEPGQWGCYIYMQGETILKASNRVYLSDTETDQWGIPLLVTNVAYDDNDVKMMKDFLVQGAEMLESAGAKNIVAEDRGWPRDSISMKWEDAEWVPTRKLRC